uniref:Uncharacterized protein n=1 Tax=Sipha flava TaxID=143950 RepID=A0A2S2Q0P4_9HEMI
MNTTIFHILQFQNSWLYVSSGETLFITCDADKESSSHAIKGVGILRLNETCKGYATRDILIPGKTNQEKHPDFIPNSILTNNGNWTSLAIMRNEDILNNIMDDLNEVSEEHDFLQFINNHTADFKTIKQHMESYDYFLYIYIYIVSCIGLLIKVELQCIRYFKIVSCGLLVIKIFLGCGVKVRSFFQLCVNTVHVELWIHKISLLKRNFITIAVRNL